MPQHAERWWIVAGQLPGAEEATTISLRVPDLLLDQFDAEVMPDYPNRSAAIRASMEAAIESSPDSDNSGRVPPEEERLAKAYEMLLARRSTNGWISEDRAVPELAQEFGIPQRAVRLSIIKPLGERGYLNVTGDISGRHRSYRVFD